MNHRPESSSHSNNLARRDFLKTTAAVAGAAACTASIAKAADASNKTPESLVKVLYDTLSPKQKETICFDWNYVDPTRGLLRTRTSNNWHITKPNIDSDFYTAEQRDLVRKIFEGLIVPEWHAKFDQQMEDDCGGFGKDQNIAIFGKPGDDKFEYVFTGRHMTMRCDGNSEEHVAFGGPIFYGHDPGAQSSNVFWEQALAANKIHEMLDGKQRKLAQVAKTPKEQDVGFRGKEGKFLGIPATELTADQKAQLQLTLNKLFEPYRKSDTAEALQCFKTQGGLDACYLAFFTDDNIEDKNIFDNWRVEGPSFVWHFRGAPHVHTWVNIADTPSVKLNA